MRKWLWIVAILSWKNIGPSDGTWIQRYDYSELNPAYRTLIAVGAGVETYEDTTVVEGIRYCYRLRHYTAAGEGPATGEKCAVMIPPPEPPEFAPAGFDLKVKK